MKKERVKKLIVCAVVLGVISAGVIVSGYPEIIPELHTQAAIEDAAGEADGLQDAETDSPLESTEADSAAESAEGETDSSEEGLSQESTEPEEEPAAEEDPADSDEKWAERVLAELPYSWDASRIVTCFTAPYPANQSSERNAKMAARYLNGTVVGAGKTFSYNETVGERTKGRGFIEAPVIYGDQMTEGLGGGVCEISTMLYNVCLQSGMKVTERSPHTLQVPYVPGGLDAAVSWGTKDLRFKNPYKEPVTILTDYDNETEKFILVLASRSGRDLLKDVRYVPISQKNSRNPDDLTYESYLQVWQGTKLTKQIDLGTTVYYGIDDAE